MLNYYVVILCQYKKVSNLRVIFFGKWDIIVCQRELLRKRSTRLKKGHPRITREIRQLLNASYENLNRFVTIRLRCIGKCREG